MIQEVIDDLTFIQKDLELSEWNRVQACIIILDTLLESFGKQE